MDFNFIANGKLDCGAIFNSLDKMDGKADNKIQASIWNAFADKVGGKHIKNYIELNNAVKSIKYYLRRGGEAVQKIMQEYFGYSTETAQKNIDDAEKMLNEVASNPSSANIEKNNEKNYKKATLPDGRWIKVWYDKDGKIEEICVSTNTQKHDEVDSNGVDKDMDVEEVVFSKERASVEGENPDEKEHNHVLEYNITSGYVFEKYKALAEKIFGAEF